MHKVLVIGAGKIGSLIAFLLAQSSDFSVTLADTLETTPHARKLGTLDNLHYVQLNAKEPNVIADFLKKNKFEAIISSLPFYYNVPIAKLAAAHQLHYFDLTEDVQTTKAVQELSIGANCAFVPQCGLSARFY